MKHQNNQPLFVGSTLVFLFLVLIACTKTFDGNLPANQQSTSNDFIVASSKTNIILMLADDFGYEIPTYTGGGSYSTPNLDFMAANGMQFPDFYCHPDGPPSRLALMTGKYNVRNWAGWGILPNDVKCIGNLLQNAGYSTCYVGKWQLEGGDVSIKNHGFNKYLVYEPYNPPNGPDQFYRRYKCPYLYENGAYLADSVVDGKYSEDMFFDYASCFIDSNLTKPFFLMYSFNLVQRPWSPSPDDPDFNAWNPSSDDTTWHKSYFPGMVAYLDKMVGKIINKVQTAGLSNKTVILFTADNATNNTISSIFLGNTVTGGKSSTTLKGLKVPMIAYWPGTVESGTMDTSLTDMTDFLPTFANIAKTPKPTTWGKLDGLTFYDNLTGTPVKEKQKSFIYCFWAPYGMHKWGDISFVYDYNYKLYDSISATHFGGTFFNIRTDPDEKSALLDSQLTTHEKTIKQRFQKIIDSAITQKGT